jgi:hypothetical protein
MDLVTTAAHSPSQTGVNALTPGSEPTPAPIPIAPAPPGDKPVAARQAARDLASWRHNRDKRNQEQQQDGAQRHGASQTRMDGLARPTAAAAAADPAQESTAKAGDAGELHPRESGDQAPPGEIESADPAATLPPIEPPRSWTKEDKELFTSLPRATQERLAERERSREGDFSRRQQEATEQRKALEAERQRAEQTRQQYESALPTLLAQLQQQQAGEFADVKSFDDLQRLATSNPLRYGQWQVHQLRIAALADDLAAAQQRQRNEQRQQFIAFAKRQDELLTEKIPDMADKANAAKMQNTALTMLKAIGFTEKELNDSFNGRLHLPIRDHRLQMLVHDAILWRDAQEKAKAAAAKPVPPVQRPGVSQPRGAARDAQIQNLTKRLETSGSLKDAAALLRARRAAR